MAQRTKAERLARVHEKARRQFDRSYGPACEQREECEADRRFYSLSGAQWAGDLGKQFENKPRLEFNKIHLSIIRIINEYRNNRISVAFHNKDGAEDETLADTCAGLYRADEQDSSAEEAYDNAFEEACAGGMGAWRLRTEYEDEGDPENDYQRIVIEPIFDADQTVFFDNDARRQDKRDAKHAFLITPMDRDAYEDEYEDDCSSWPTDVDNQGFDWVTPDVVWLAEYFVVEEVKQTIHVWAAIDGTETRYTEDELEIEFDKLTATGAEEVRTKKITKKRVHKYLMNGSHVIEDCGYIAGSCVPIIPVYGKRWVIAGIERFMGHVRLAKDAQRLKNMQLSKLAEYSADGVKEKPIFVPEQVAGHELTWADDNVKNYPYALVNPVTNPDGSEMPAGPLGYTKPTEIPPALAALLQITEQDMMDLLGNQQTGEELVGNVSTETTMIQQSRLDMQTYIYMSNMAKAMRRCGEIWLGMAKDVLVESGRQMKTLGDQGENERITLNEPQIAEDGSTTRGADLSKASFDVVADVGPSSSTKKSATVRTLTSIAGVTDDPETKQVLGAMMMLNIEGEGVHETRSFFRKKLLRMGVLDPTEKEQEELQAESQNAKPNAQDQYYEASAQSEQARGAKAIADAGLAEAKTEKTRIETVDVATDIDGKEQAQAMEVMDRVNARQQPPPVQQ